MALFEMLSLEESLKERSENKTLPRGDYAKELRAIIHIRLMFGELLNLVR